MTNIRYLNTASVFTASMPASEREAIFRAALRENFRPAINVGLAAGMAQREPSSSPMEFDPTWIQDAMGSSTPVSTGRLKLVTELLAHGAVPESTENHGAITPLMWAARRGDIGIIKILLDAGADMKRKDYDQQDAFDHALDNDLFGVLVTLKERGYVPSAAQKALAGVSSPPEVIKLLAGVWPTVPSSPKP